MKVCNIDKFMIHIIILIATIFTSTVSIALEKQSDSFNGLIDFGDH